MSKWSSSWLAAALSAGLFAAAGAVRAQEDEGLGFERTPPRLSFLDGEVSYLRPGAEDWTAAAVNTALAPGDELSTGAGANVEMQVGGRAFARAGENTQLALTSLEPDYLQLRVTSGHVSLDLRELKSGQTFEIDTPNAAFTIERSGYYRVGVDQTSTTFIGRRGGQATLTPAAGESLPIPSNQQVVITGDAAPQIETLAAPELDAWDRWNYARTEGQLDPASARYVSPGVYGTSDLDRYGDWRVVPTYGAIWVPRGVAAGWVPYSTGRWVYDPYYQWTWVDDAPWGWAPYHYGRWVHYSGYWGWAPGPIVAYPYYAPALVAFYGGGFSVGVTFGYPYLGWVGLGWGEPLIPWWGPAYFRAYPHWVGWGGPRYFNHHAYHHHKVYDVHHLNYYRNAHVRGAIVAVDRDHFGRRWHDGRRWDDSNRWDERNRWDGGRRWNQGSRFTRASGDRDSWRPLHDGPGVRPDRSSLVADARSGRRPAREDRQRSVVATRQPRFDAVQGLDTRRSAADADGRGGRARAAVRAPEGLPAARVVEATRDGGRFQASRNLQASQRPAFGAGSDGARGSQFAPRSRQRELAAQTSPPAGRDQARGRGPRVDGSRDPAARQRTAREQRSLSRPNPPAPRAERAPTARGEDVRRRGQATAPRRELAGRSASREVRERGARPQRVARAERSARPDRIERAGREPQLQARADRPGRSGWQPSRPQSVQPDRQRASGGRPQWSQRGPEVRQQAPQRQSGRGAEARPQFQARAQGGASSGAPRAQGGGGGGGNRGGSRGGNSGGGNGGSGWSGGWSGGGGRGGR
jgi:hypothetical protein